MTESTPSARPAWRRPAVVLCALALAGAAAAAIWQRLRPSPAELGLLARQAIARGDLPLAGTLAQRALARDPHCAAALLAAGDLASRERDADGAVGYYDRVPRAPMHERIAALGAAGDLLVQYGRMHEAEARFREVLELEPEHPLALHRLGAILVMSGRRRESAEPLFHLVRLGQNELDELALLGNLDQLFDDGQLIDNFRKLAPQDPLLKLAAAGYSLHKHEPSKAIPLLTSALESHPDLLDGRLRLGRALVETGNAEGLRSWQAALPSVAEDIPETWLVRGQYAQQREQTDAALRCFWEAARRDPNLWRAHVFLAQVLSARGHPAAERFALRADQLRDLGDALKTILRDGPTDKLVATVARLCDRLHRPWEAWGWYAALASRLPDDPSAAQERDRLQALLEEDTPQTLPEGWLAASLDFSGLPLPEFGDAPSGVPPAPAATRSAAPRFVDEARARGIDFTYVNGDDPDKPGMGIWQSIGGGVAVIDFDGDGWPDLHWTQAGEWTSAPEDRTHFDKLFRNTGGGSFDDVTARAGVADDGYSHGPAVGDFDSDGFPDLFIASIGGSRLYHNRGDGTFDDVTGPTGIADDLWSSGGAFVDLNGDGLPELYQVTYLTGQSPFTEICINETVQAPRACGPFLFTAEHDRLFLNRGDGRLGDISEAAGIRQPEGKGLGIVAYVPEPGALPTVFIANDGTGNFLFANVTSARGGLPRFEERAALSGCAYDLEGRGQASMGIALDDADGDGLLDLFVTTFYLEHNSLFRQQPGGLFLESSGQSGLKEPSVPMLAFGTQFLDAELDGWPDLVLGNGHIDDYSAKGDPFRMRPQFFSNLGRGRFLERSASELGEFFAREQLGRGLARVDWNRDGLDDFALSHVDTPAALLTNQTREHGHYLGLTLRGIDSARDAIGTVIDVTAGGRTWRKQLTGGDGFAASNQRRVTFGLGTIPRVDEVVVTWPSGAVQRWRGLPVDRDWLIVEGRRDPVGVTP